MIECFGLTWLSLSSIYLMPVFVLLGCLHLWTLYRRVGLVKLLADPAWQQELVRHFSVRLVIIKGMLFCCALLWLFFALLRPACEKKEELVQQEGREILIALDVSRSMLAQDYKPNRLEAAKQKIHRLLGGLSCDRVGLLLFAGTAVVQCPLTTDYAAFNLFLDQVDAHTISSGTTALEGALQKAVDLFGAQPNARNKLIVLFTDGEDFSSNLAAIRGKAQELGITIFTVGIATTQGAPIPVYNLYGKQMGHQKDEHEQIVISRLNEGILRSLAHEAGGSYVQATGSDTDIEHIIQRVALIEKERFEDRHVSRYEELYHYCIAIALLCLGVEWIL